MSREPYGHETYGSDYEVPCPWCGVDQCIIDYSIDDVLKEGLKFDCSDCSKRIVIANIEYSVNVTADRDDDPDGRPSL